MGAPTTDAGLLGLYRYWYTEKDLQNLFFRDSPVIQKLKKTRVGGQAYKYAMLYGRGGAVAGDATVAAAVAATTAKVAEATAGIGKIFSIFNVTDLERKASQDIKGAYAPAAVAKMFCATDGARKALAASFYGSGFGELSNLNGAVLAGASTAIVDSVISFEVGTRFVVTTTGSATALPSSALVGGGTGTVFTVTAIDDATNTLTFDPVAPGGGFVDNAWINLAGSRDGSGNGLLPEGMGAILPSYFSRTGANWTGYIGTAFRGVTRSNAVARLAGNYYKNTGAELYEDCIMKGIRLVRRQGGIPDMIVMNDEDLLTMMASLNTKTNYMQMVNTGDRKTANEVTKGIKAVSMVFQTSYLEYIYDDPFCPKGFAFILDSESLDLVTITDAEKVTKNSIADNQPGTDSVLDAKDPVGQPYALDIEDYLTIQPGSLAADGPGAQVIVNMFMNFVNYNPAHSCVVQLA